MSKSPQQQIVASAFAAALALGLAGTASAADQPKETCSGIAQAGQNDCANLSGSHSCAGQTKMDMSAVAWKYVNTGTCKSAGGMSAAEA